MTEEIKQEVKLGMTVTDMAGRYLGVVHRIYDDTYTSFYIRYWSEFFNKYMYYCRVPSVIKILDDEEVRLATKEDPRRDGWWELYAPMALELAVATGDKAWFDYIHEQLAASKGNLLKE